MAILRTMQNLVNAIVALAFLNTAASAEITIATVGPMKGQYASLGEQLQKGAGLAVSEINAAGGINGQQLILDVEDDACDPKQAVVIAGQLVAKGIKLVAGHYCSGSSIAVAKIYEAAGILMISPSSTNPKFTDSGSWNTNRICGRDDAQGAFAGRAIAKAYSGKSVVILDDGSVSGSSLAQSFKTALNAGGVTERMRATYKPGQNDYDEIVQRILSADAEVVYVGGFAGEAGTIIRQLRELASNAIVIGGDALLAEQFWSTAGTAGEGSMATFAADPQKFESARAVVSRFQATGFSPEGYTLHAYAAVQAFAQAASATGSFDGKTLSQWLRAGNAVNTVVGNLRLDSKGDVKDATYAWYKWSAGKYTEVQSFP